MKKRFIPALLFALLSAGVPQVASAQGGIHTQFKQCLAAARTELERSECHWQKAQSQRRLSK